MPTLSLNVGATQELSGPIDNIIVQIGQVLIADRSLDPPSVDIVTAESDDQGEVVHDCNGSGGIVLHSITGCQVVVNGVLDLIDAPTREEIAAQGQEAERGDSGGDTGSYESRTLKELRKLAKDRKLTGYSDLDKDALIAELRK